MAALLKDIVRRAASAVLTLLGVVTLAFVILRLAPGDPVSTLLGDYKGTPEMVEELKKDYGLDKPAYVQYGLYIANAATGEFGKSLRTNRGVMDEILRVFPYTFFLALAAVACAVLLGVPLGIASALRNNSGVDHALRLFAILGICTPSFWLALLLMLVFSVYLGWFPLIGGGDVKDPLNFLYYLVLPAVALGMRDAASVSRIVRSTMLDLLRQDFILTARAKGLPERTVIFKHALRNCMVTTLTVVALEFGYTLGGTIVIEAVFSRPGIGTLIVQAISARDYPQLQGTVLFFAFCFIIVNLATDILYRLIDPRIDFGKAA
jgi:peptide/nickel transport system permease protein